MSLILTSSMVGDIRHYFVTQALPAVVDLDVTLRKYHTVHALLLGHWWLEC